MGWRFVDYSLLSRRWSGAFPYDNTALGVHLWYLSMRLLTELSEAVGFCATTTWVMFLYVPFCMYLARSSSLERSKWMGKVELVQFQTKKDQHCNKVEMFQGFLWGLFCGQSTE